MTSFSAPLRSLTLIALAAGMAHAAVDITSVSPNHGVITGGTVVVITGTGLGLLNATTMIQIGGQDVQSIISTSATQVVVTTKTGMTQGSVNVVGNDTVTNDTLGGFIAYETNTATLDINISVSIAQTLYLAWTAETIENGTRVTEGDTTAVSWNIGAVTISQLVQTAAVTSAAAPAAPTAGDYNFQVRNAGNGPIDLSIRESSGAGGSWVRSADLVPGVDEYVLGVSTDLGVNWVAIDAAAAASAVEISANLASFGLQQFDLLFQAPSAVTTFGAKSMTVTVTATTPD